MAQNNKKKEKEKQTLDFELTVSKEEFVSKKDGQVIKYFNCTVDLFGEKFRLVPKDEDKRMFNHILKEIFSELDNEKVELENQEQEKEDDDELLL